MRTISQLPRITERERERKPERIAERGFLSFETDQRLESCCYEREEMSAFERNQKVVCA